MLIQFRGAGHGSRIKLSNHKVLMEWFFRYFLSSVILVGCSITGSEELGRISIKKASISELNVGEISIELKKNDKIFFWNEMDIEYSDPELLIYYAVELYIDGNKLGGFELNALETNPTMYETKVYSSGQGHWSFTGKMNHYKVNQTGKYRFRIVINTSDPTLKLKKANFVIKR